MFKLQKSKIFDRFRKNRRFFQKKAISNTTIISIIGLVVIGLIFLLLINSFSKRVNIADESSSVNKCKLAGTNNLCCEPYSANEITPKAGGWSDCKEPLSSCCVG